MGEGPGKGSTAGLTDLAEVTGDEGTEEGLNVDAERGISLAIIVVDIYGVLSVGRSACSGRAPREFSVHVSDCWLVWRQRQAYMGGVGVATGTGTGLEMSTGTGTGPGTGPGAGLGTGLGAGPGTGRESKYPLQGYNRYGLFWRVQTGSSTGYTTGSATRTPSEKTTFSGLHVVKFC